MDSEDNNLTLEVFDVDYAPESLRNQLPFKVSIIRKISGIDRDDYWLGRASKKIKWCADKNEYMSKYVILATRHAGAIVTSGIESVAVGLALVSDESLLDDDNFDFKKAYYIAIALVSDIAVAKPPKRFKISRLHNL